MTQRVIAIAALVWTVALVTTHLTVPFAWQWGVSAGFSVLMNLVYPWQAFRTGSSRRAEFVIAAFLVFLSMAGAFVSPWLLVLAVAGHGVWDIAKHLGAGVSFFSGIRWVVPSLISYGQQDWFCYYIRHPEECLRLALGRL